jgi:Flp pilus assembly protein protease CpaA
LHAPVGTAVVTDQDQSIVAHGPALFIIDKVYAGQHLGGGNARLLPVFAAVIRIQDMPVFPCNQDPLTCR